MRKLPAARAPFCLGVVAAYAILSYRGGRHLQRIWETSDCHEELLNDYTLMIALYACEVVGAVLFGVTTLYKWSRRHFLEHHLPLIIISVLIISQNEPTNGRAFCQHKEWTALVLLICCNESSAALLTVWPSQALERWRVLPNILIQFLLLLSEVTSWFRATRHQLRDHDPAMWIPLILSQFLLAAAVIHVSYLKSLTKVAAKLWLRRAPPPTKSAASKKKGALVASS